MTRTKPDRKPKPETGIVGSQDAAAPVLPEAPDPHEVGPLAQELALRYRRAVEYYRREYKMEPAAADAEVQKRYVGNWPMPEPQQATWLDIERISAVDAEEGLALWQRVKEAARDEFLSGWRGARVMEAGLQGEAWQRAQYAAVRSALVDYWKPHPGELPLIDTMAQAHTMYLWQMEILVTYTTLETREQKDQYDKQGYTLPPRVHWAQAIEGAMATADKFNRLYLRTMRHLQNLRRYSPPVTIQNAGQVNIGAQQVNLAGDVDSGDIE